MKKQILPGILMIMAFVAFVLSFYAWPKTTYCQFVLATSSEEPARDYLVEVNKDYNVAKLSSDISFVSLRDTFDENMVVVVDEIVEETERQIAAAQAAQNAVNQNYSGGGGYSGGNGGGGGGNSAYVEPSYTYGNLGRLLIPAAGVSVGLNTGDDWQGIVDAWDSALSHGTINGCTIIADHCNQAFAGLFAVGVGTQAQIVSPEGTRYLTCIAVHNGINAVYTLDINGTRWEELYPGCTAMYTCTYDWEHIYMTIWQ